MKATVLYGAGDIRVETRPDPRIEAPSDAIVRVVLTGICGTDLTPYSAKEPSVEGQLMGHEFLGVVEEAGADVRTLKPGDLVVSPWRWSDGTCDYCALGLTTSCRHGGGFARDGVDGGQGELVRVPQAQGTLVKLPVAEDSSLLPSLLTLADALGTGHHSAITAGVTAGTSVTVVGDGAVGLCAVLAAKRLGAEQIILMGRHQTRTDLGRFFGASDVVAERGEEGAAKLRELTRGKGTDAVLECVGSKATLQMSLEVVRDGGTVSRVGLAQYAEGPLGPGLQMRNITLTGGASPARAYIPDLMPDVLAGVIEPGRVFDRTVSLDEIAAGYRGMADRQAVKVLVRP